MALYPPSHPYQWTFRRVMWATLVFILVALGFWLLYRFHQVIFLLFVAMVMGTVIRPGVTWLQRRGLPRVAAAILVYLLLLASIISFVLLLFPLIVEQGTTIAAAAPGYYQSLREWMVHYPNPLIVRLSEFLPATPQILAPAQQSGEEVMALAGQAVGYIALIGNFIFLATAVLLLSFHWTLEGPRSIRSLLLLIPQGQRDGIGDLISAMETKVGLYIAGQGVLCLIIGIMALIAYLLIGLPNALVLALVAGVLEAVPMIGPLLGALPAAAVALSIAPSKFVWVIVATVVIQQLENSLLVPRVMRKTVGVNPFVSLLAFFAFTSLLGLAGAFMAIPLAAMLQLLLDRFIFERSVIEAEVSTGRDYTSRLRYETQDLAKDLRKQARVKKWSADQGIKQTDQVMDEIEAIAANLDSLLSQAQTGGAP